MVTHRRVRRSRRFPSAIAADGHGDVWVLASTSDTIVAYRESQLVAGGDPAPVVTLSSDGSGSLSNPAGMAFDAAGDLWVANDAGDDNSIVEFTARQLAAGGSPVPAVTLKGSAGPRGALAFSPAGDLWVAAWTTSNNSELLELTEAELSASGAPQPAVTLQTGGQPPSSLRFDSRGDLWFGGEASPFGPSTINELTPDQLTASGTPTATVQIRSDTSMPISYDPQALAFDSAGDLWLSSDIPIATARALDEFTPSQLAASGNPTPATIAGAATGLVDPGPIAITQAPSVTAVTPASGPASGGTSVTITGSGFYPGAMVSFGSTPATAVTYISPYEVKAVVPASSGTVDVTVATGYGTSATSSVDRFTFPIPATTTPVTTAPVTTATNTTTTTPVSTTTSAVTTTTPTTPTSTPTTTTARKSSRPRPRIRSVSRRLIVIRNSAAVPLACALIRCAGMIRLTEQVKTRARLHRRIVTRSKTIALGRARYGLTANRHATIEVRLTAAGRRALARATRRQLAARLSVTVARGSTFTARVTLLARARPTHRQVGRRPGDARSRRRRSGGGR